MTKVKIYALCWKCTSAKGAQNLPPRYRSVDSFNSNQKASETHTTHWDLDLGKCRHVRDPDNDPRWGRKFSSRGRPEDSFPSRQHAARLFSNLIPAPDRMRLKRTRDD
uniref:Uncharacterized protein n=1 Tax=Anopheles coluzzii TaxID=1518534 RepID=A0A8W7PZ44_ANOCL